MSDETVTLNVKGLDQLLKALKTSPPTARIGILGGTPRKANSSSHNPTNAEVGAAHEFGTASIPMRSFLRVPISEKLQKRMEDSGALDKEVLTSVVKNGTLLPWLKKVAVLAEGIVVDAFDTGGFGKWPGWKTPGYQNNSGQLLVDTTQLRDSITSEVKE